jgi:predicted ATP-dependent endonuclease of OLD family
MRIRNYKSFLDSGEIMLDEKIFAFIGQNNTGKSTILDAVKVFFPNYKKQVDKKDIHRGINDSIIIEMWLGGVESFFENTRTDEVDRQVEKLLSKADDNSLYIKLVLNIEDGTNKNIRKYFDKDGEEIKEATLKKLLPELVVIPAIRDPEKESTADRKSYLRSLIDILDSEYKTDILIKDEGVEKRVNYSQLNDILTKEARKRCESLSQKITEYYNSTLGNNNFRINLEPTVDIYSATKYNTSIVEIIGNEKIENDILNFGTGYQSVLILSILQTYVEIARSVGKYIFVIEEPEIYLHPNLQRKMIETLINISERNQVIFTSHSPITISNLPKKNVKLVLREREKSIVKEINPKEVINELGIKADDFLGSKGIIFVEGKDDFEVVRELICKLDDNLLNMINVIPVNSCCNLKFFANAELFLNKYFEIPVVIIRDADTNDPEKLKSDFLKEMFEFIKQYEFADSEIVEKKKKLVQNTNILQHYSIEYYFLNELFLKDYYDYYHDNPKSLEIAITCYKCKYNLLIDKVRKNQMSKEEFAKLYQPKRFLRGFLDKNTNERERYEMYFKEKWEKLFDSCACEDVDERKNNFFKVRDNIIQNISIKRKGEKSTFYTDVLRKHHLQELEMTELNEVIQILKNFVNTLIKNNNKS